MLEMNTQVCDSARIAALGNLATEVVRILPDPNTVDGVAVLAGSHEGLHLATVHPGETSEAEFVVTQTAILSPYVTRSATLAIVDGVLCASWYASETGAVRACAPEFRLKDMGALPVKEQMSDSCAQMLLPEGSVAADHWRRW